MTTLTPEQHQSIVGLLSKTPELSRGLGNKEKMCSVAAINLALTGELTDSVPECMSEVIGRWVRGVQDNMPVHIRNSFKWRDLLPLAAGTGRDLECERADILLRWMWGCVMAAAQDAADERQLGTQWKSMLESRTVETIGVVLLELDNSQQSFSYMSSIRESLTSAKSATLLRSSCNTYKAVSYFVATAARRIGEVAESHSVYWDSLDPCGLLEELINVKKAE
jgi:hypothetical protein